MAARRLIRVLLVLLIVSTFAATLVPPPERESDEPTAPTTTTGAAEQRGRLIHATVSADAKRPARVRVARGDELELRVTARRFHEVEIATLGEFDEVDQFAPAIFDLVLDETGTHPVRALEGDRVIARIVVVNESGRRA
jgi:hypothetical protein